MGRKENITSKDFKYLGYTFNEIATNKTHIREIVRKANKVLGCVWGMEERKWGSDFRRKMMMFESTIEIILMYGAEIWGRKEQEKVEKVQQKYLRRVLGETSGGWKGRVQDTNWMRERKENEHGEEGKRAIPPDRVCQWRSGKIKRAKGRWMSVELNERDKDTDKQERRERIKESRYNREYERWQRIFRSTWGRECKRKKYDGEKERKEGAEWAMRRER
jgi:hypothetical protein